MKKNRRQFLHRLAGGLALANCRSIERSGFSDDTSKATATSEPFFQTRGIVLIPDDLTWRDWPERAHRAGLTTIGLHHGVSPRLVVNFIRSDNGQRFLDQCRRLNLQVEYELHAARELLPRDLFGKNQHFFRMNEKGERTPDANLCVHSSEALGIAAQNSLALAKTLRPTTHRYFYWGDDAKSWCQCSQCRGFSPSDQALILEHHLLSALRGFDAQAQLAHLAYSNTLWPPKHVKPEPGIFLEYAPINRRYDLPYNHQTGPEAKDSLDALDANLEIFGHETAQALEYWLDVSRFSKWKKPAVKLPWHEKAFAADLNAYAARRIRHLTSFAVFIDADYVGKFGEPRELGAYGDNLRRWRPAELRD